MHASSFKPINLFFQSTSHLQQTQPLHHLPRSPDLGQRDSAASLCAGAPPFLQQQQTHTKANGGYPAAGALPLPPHTRPTLSVGHAPIQRVSTPATHMQGRGQQQHAAATAHHPLKHPAAPKPAAASASSAAPPAAHAGSCCPSAAADLADQATDTYIYCQVPSRLLAAAASTPAAAQAAPHLPLRSPPAPPPAAVQLPHWKRASLVPLLSCITLTQLPASSSKYNQ